VVGVNTSAMIEAAIVGRPVLSIAVSQFEARQEGTLHFHHLLPENGGFLQMARSIDEHLPQLAEAITQPGRWSDRTARFVDAFVRPLGRERPCTPILADELERAATLTQVAAHPSMADAPLRAGLLIVAALAWPIEELASDKPFGSLRKKLRNGFHRWRKELKSSAVRKWI
jgi:hypothetical protein